MKRRRVLQLGAALGGGLLAPKNGSASELGRPLGPYGERSKFEKGIRFTRESKTPEAGASFTPLAESQGILTPSSLHYERHHAGIPDIDPSGHRLVIQGMVERPLILTVDEIKRLPSISRILLVECGGNSGSEWAARTAADVQRSHGLASCSEWTGVPLRLLLEEVGVKQGASWLIAEGADAGRMQRSIPLSKGMDDMLLAHGQNGEALRPEQGYPLRLVVPGWEGATHVKWLQRIVVAERTVPEPRRNIEIHRPDAGRQGAPVHVRHGSEVRHHVSVRRTDFAGSGSDELTGLAWSGRRQSRARRRDGRWGTHVAGSPVAGTAAPARFRPVSSAVAMGRPGNHHRLAMRRRNWIRSANARGVDRGTRRQLRLPLQRHQVVESRGQREGDQCGGLTRWQRPGGRGRLLRERDGLRAITEIRRRARAD